MVAGLGVESSRTESCDTDVGDVLVDDLESPVDKTRTTTGTQFSALRCIFPAVFWISSGL